VVEKLKEEYNVDVEWRPFYLYWDTPLEGLELPDYVKRARANGSEERLASIARNYGMDFRSTERIYNTRLAHEATEYARENGNPVRFNFPSQRNERGKANEFHKALFRRVYAEGQDPSSWEVLRSTAEEVGLNADEMQQLVESNRYTDFVAEQVRWAQQIGVTGVPTYVINDRYAVVGAQPYEVFKNTLTQIMSQKRE
jgi:predicted DsbA family dithiol-disulfide isomerase